MATAKKAGPKAARKMDPKLVARKQAHDVKYESKKIKASTAEIRAAVKKVGNSRSKVEAEIKRKKATLQQSCARI